MPVREDTLDMFYGTAFQAVRPFKTQLLKWVGNKQRFEHTSNKTISADCDERKQGELGRSGRSQGGHW